MTKRLKEFTWQYDLLIPLDNTNRDTLCELFNKKHYPDGEELYLVIFSERDYDIRAIVNTFDGLLEEFIRIPEYYYRFKKLIISAKHIEKATALMSIDVSHSKIIEDMIIPLLKDSPVQSYSEWFHET